MQPVKEKIKGIKYELSFEIPADVFETKLNEQLAEFAKNHEEKVSVRVMFLWML